MTGARIALSAVLAVALTGCSSLGGLSPGSGTPAAALDPLNDDVSTMVLAVDLPDALSPGREGPRLLFGAGPARLDIVYGFGDAEAVMSALPEPADGRRYVIYDLSPADRGRVRAAQDAGAIALEVIPQVCATSAARRDRDTVAVLGILAGGRIVRLVPPETVAALDARTGTLTPDCD